ncbi:MAG: group II intron reverse transcriptase/maturase [Oligoflexales bacterium]|nr:group II intron reverse transcriptase/maturase [Oligoflexales bacterium]
MFNNLLCLYNLENFREAYRALDGTKARGIDGVSKREYGERLEDNLKDLVNRIHKGSYRPQNKLRAFIPKVSGKARPIAISAFEDKLVEWVAAKILNAIYEPLFIQNSFGFREGKKGHEALRAVFMAMKDDKRPQVVEIDLASFFDTLNHRRMIKLLAMRTNDRRFLSLLSRFMTAGIFEKGEIYEPDKGAAQGSIMSPALANIYLHHCLDEWFSKNYSKQGIMVRYADDAIFLFELKHEAEEFLNKLEERLTLFGLKLNKEKSGIINMGKKNGNIVSFLGFTLYWGRAFKSTRSQLKVKTAKPTLFKKIGEFQNWIKKVRSQLPITRIWEITAAKLRGHYNYYGVIHNRAKLNHYYHSVIWSLYRWLNRRSQKRSFNWKGFSDRLAQFPLPVPPPIKALYPLDTQMARFYAYAR